MGIKQTVQRAQMHKCFDTLFCRVIGSAKQSWQIGKGYALEIRVHHWQMHAGHSQMRALALPFLTALMLHVLVLSQYTSQPGYEERKVSRPLSVRLMADPAPVAVVRKSLRATPSASTRMADTLTSDASDARLDMNLIRGQARAYAAESLSDNEPALSIEGDYYGSFSGDDSGVFYVHLYANGHASGTGESHSISIPFMISGDVDKEGVISMQGSGIAGDARFTGQLNIATGTVTGNWNVPGFMKGRFTAHRDALRSARNGF